MTPEELEELPEGVHPLGEVIDDLLPAIAQVIDEGQASGEIATDGRPKTVRTADSFADLGVDRQRLAEARDQLDRET